MNHIISQLSTLKIAKFRIILQAQSDAILPALIGSTLRGAFGHALKAISCCVPHKNCENCFLSSACPYTTVFEPVSTKNQDLPRPFIFEPPTPPLTCEISRNSTLKLRVGKSNKVSFEFVLMGEAIGKLPYFIYAFELFARHGLGISRFSFSISEVYVIDEFDNLKKVYEPPDNNIADFQYFDLAIYVRRRLKEIAVQNSLKISLLTPLRIRRNGKMIEKINFGEFFKSCSLRLKLIFENYAKLPEYDYFGLMEESKTVRTKEDNLWRHNSSRYSNRQQNKLDLDGMLGEIEFQKVLLEGFLVCILAGEILHIGSASAMGLGKFRLL